jgi:hypothetical protein
MLKCMQFWSEFFLLRDGDVQKLWIEQTSICICGYSCDQICKCTRCRHKSDIGHVIWDATEFPVLAYTVDQLELTAKVPPISCHSRQASLLHVQCMGSEPHENIKIKKYVRTKNLKTKWPKIKSFSDTDVRTFTNAVSTKNLQDC